MGALNDNVRNYLNGYLARTDKPGFAVLIKGKWGAGKSWFVENYFLNRMKAEASEKKTDKEIEEEFKKKKNYLYVSLYGLPNIAAINDELFTQVHPMLSKKGMWLAASVFKSTFKLSANFNAYGDDKPDGSLSLGLPGGDIFNTIAAAGKQVLVFDDLERCTIPLNDVLGFINQFVEHEGSKVIILANQEEIESREGTEIANIEYSRIKEKLIGKEFELKPDVESAVASFIEETEGMKIRLQPHISHISELYLQSKLDNLRRIRQALIEFSYWASLLDKTTLDNDKFFKQFLSLFCIYWMEVGTGNVRTSEIELLSAWVHLGSFGTNSTDRSEVISETARKYPTMDISKTVIAHSSWKKLICGENFEKDDFVNEILTSEYFKGSEMASWLKLWHWEDYSSTEFYKVVKQSETEFQKGDLKQVEEVLHVAGVLLKLHDENLYLPSKNDIVIDAIKHIDELKMRNQIQPRDIHDQFLYELDAWAGYQYHSWHTAEFKKIVFYATWVKEEVTEAHLKTLWLSYLDLMVSDTNAFSIQMSHGTNGKYATYPIFSLTSPQSFFDAWKQINNRNRRKISYMFDSRYQHVATIRSAIKELHWLRELLIIVNAEMSLLSTQHDIRSYSMFEKNIQDEIKFIEKYYFNYLYLP